MQIGGIQMQMARRGQEMKTLREQIAKLEADLGLAQCAARQQVARRPPRPGKFQPQLASLGLSEGRPRKAAAALRQAHDAMATGWKCPAHIV